MSRKIRQGTRVPFEQSGFGILAAHLPSPRIILVTGAGGFVGRAVVAALAADGAEVRALSRTDSSAAWSHPLVTPVRGNLLDRRSLDAAVDGVSAVVHLAAEIEGTPDMLRQVNVEGTRALANAARQARVSLVVHGSSAGVYGDGNTWTSHTETTVPAPQTPYEQTKLDAERGLREVLGDAVPWVVLRPTGVHGATRPATLAFYRHVAHRRIWPHGSTTQLVHPTTVEDVVCAVRAALVRPDVAGRVFNVGGERALPLPELIAIIARHIGVRVWQPRLPGSTRRVAAVLDTAGVARGLMRRLTRHVVNRSVDISAAREALAFLPVPLDEAIAKNVAAFVERGAL